MEAGEVGPGNHVYEVGPGLGVLTRALAETGAKVTALEKDTHLKNVLAETLTGLDLELVWGDALEFDWSGVPQGSILVANLPYYISTAILSRVMQSGRFARATFLVQREVAERLIAAPGTENYGFLSALTQLYGRAKIVRNVPKNAFLPAPDVTSSVVRVDLSGELPDPSLIKLLEASLAYRRKTLKNNLERAGYNLEILNQALERLELSPSVRGEALSLEQLKTLHSLFQNAPGTP